MWSSRSAPLPWLKLRLSAPILKLLAAAYADNRDLLLHSTQTQTETGRQTDRERQTDEGNPLLVLGSGSAITQAAKIPKRSKLLCESSLAGEVVAAIL